MLQDAKMGPHPSEREMLEATLGWLENIDHAPLDVLRGALDGHEVYLAAMPNNCLGVRAMRERLEHLDIARATLKDGLGLIYVTHVGVRQRHLLMVTDPDNIKGETLCGSLGDWERYNRKFHGRRLACGECEEAKTKTI